MSWWTKRYPRRRLCQACGREFDAQRGDAKTCGAACRKRLSRANAKREEVLKGHASPPAVKRDRRAQP